MLSEKDVRAFYSIIDKSKSIALLAGFESWTVDDLSADTRQLVSRIGKSIKLANKEQLGDIPMGEWAGLLAIITLPKSLIIAQKLEEEFPGFMVDLISEADEKLDDVGLVTQRNRLVALYRINALSHIFSEKRASAIAKYLKFKKDSNDS